MAEPKPFAAVKYITGVIYAEELILARAVQRLEALLGPVDLKSDGFPFVLTGYYDREMGGELKRIFLSFGRLGRPEDLAAIKIATNKLESELASEAGSPGRVVNIDPGYLTSSALIMATAKNFAHRIPLNDGIYAHLELLFRRHGLKFLEWTYPDIRTEPGCADFFLKARLIYLEDLNKSGLA